MNQASLIAPVAERCSLPWHGAAIVVVAVLDALARVLPGDSLSHLGIELPLPLQREALRTLDDVVLKVSGATGATRDDALQEVALICSLIGESWSDEERRAALSLVPANIAVLFAPVS